jgi:uncharacterized membrane protein
MKRTNGFDARRLRPRDHRSLSSRLGALFGLLLTFFGMFLAFVGAASLLSNHQALAALAVAREVAVVFLLLGLGLMWAGLEIRRRVRRSLLAPSGLSLSPRLMKKRN